MILGSDMPPNVPAMRGLGGYQQQLVQREYGTAWECGCPEYRTIRPNTPRACCRQTQRCADSGLCQLAGLGQQ